MTRKPAIVFFLCLTGYFKPSFFCGAGNCVDENSARFTQTDVIARATNRRYQYLMEILNRIEFTALGAPPGKSSLAHGTISL